MRAPVVEEHEAVQVGGPKPVALQQRLDRFRLQRAELQLAIDIMVD